MARSQISNDAMDVNSSNWNWRSMLNLLPGALLLCAAAMKVQQLATIPIYDSFMLSSRELSLAFVFFEMVLGIWLLSGWLGSYSRRLALCVFSVFALINLYKISAGIESCGCFGSQKVSPWVSFCLDVVAFTLLYFWIVKKSIQAPKLGALGLVVSVGLSLAQLSSFSPITLDEVGMSVDGGQLIVIEHERWAGKRFPLIEFIEGKKDALVYGQWRVILYHEDCPKCQKLLEDASLQKDKSIAFIEVPPVRSAGRSSSGQHLWLSLKDNYSWFVDAPAVLTIRNGFVVGESEL